MTIRCMEQSSVCVCPEEVQVCKILDSTGLCCALVWSPTKVAYKGDGARIIVHKTVALSCFFMTKETKVFVIKFRDMAALSWSSSVVSIGLFESPTPGTRSVAER